MEQMIEVDDRGRTTLSTPRGERRRYLQTDLPDGTVILHPAILMSEAQARLMANPEFFAQITRANSLPDSEMVRRPRLKRRAPADG